MSGSHVAKRLLLLDDSIRILIHDMLEEKSLELSWAETIWEGQLDKVLRVGLEM